MSSLGSSAEPPPRSDAELLVAQAWSSLDMDFVGNSAENAAQLAEAWRTLDSIERPVPVDSDPGYMLGQLILTHAPIFEAWGSRRAANRGDLEQVHLNAANTMITPGRGDPPLAELNSRTFGVVRRAVTSLLISRKRAKTGEDADIYVSYPAGPYAAEDDFDDESDRGYRHLEVLTPYDDDPVPIRVFDTASAAHQEGIHKEQDNVLVIGLGQLMLGLAKKSPEFRSRYAGMANPDARTAVTVDVADMLVREARRLEMPKANYVLLTAISNMLIKQIDDYSTTWQQRQQQRGQ